MWIIFDLLIIGIVGVSTFIGYKQGLVKALIKIFSFVIAIVISLALYKPVSNIIIKNTAIDDNIKNAIIEKILPEGADKNQEVIIEDNIVNKIKGEASNTVEGIAETFSTKIIEAIVLLVLFIILKIILKIICVITDLITKLPGLKQLNKTRWYSIWINQRNTYCLCNFSNCLFNFSFSKQGHNQRNR